MFVSCFFLHLVLAGGSLFNITRWHQYLYNDRTLNSETTTRLQAICCNVQQRGSHFNSIGVSVEGGPAYCSLRVLNMAFEPTENPKTCLFRPPRRLAPSARHRWGCFTLSGACAACAVIRPGTCALGRGKCSFCCPLSAALAPIAAPVSQTTPHNPQM